MAKSALLIRMIDLLRDRPGISVSELATILNRSERTVYRWLNEIAEELRTPLYCRDGGYYMSAGLEPRQVEFAPEELLALRLSLKSAPFAEGSPIRKHAELAWAKIRESAQCDELSRIRELASNRVMNVHMPSADVDTWVIEALEKAIDARERLKVVYRSQKSSEVKDYTIDPYAMVFRRHSWYVLAFSHEHGKVIQMRLARFREAKGTGAKFDVPADFRVDDYFNLSWEAWAGGEPTRVRVRFSPDVAEMIAEVRRHPTQVTYPQDNGDVIFEATVAGIEEIALWIMGYGREAVVLEPDSLRKHIIEHITGMAENYRAAERELEAV